MKTLTLHQLRILALVAKHGSYSRAADELQLTQPAVSMQLRLLEETAGLPLFMKTGRSVKLTEAGEKMLACSIGVAELVDKTRESIDALRGLKTGSVKLCAVGSSTYFAPYLIAQFSLQFPLIRVHFSSVETQDESLPQLRRGEIDFVIIGSALRSKDLVSEPFARNPYVFIAPLDHPLARRSRISLKQLAGEQFLSRGRNTDTRASLERMLARQRMAFAPIQELHSQETIKQATLAGMGIGFLSMHAAAAELSARKLCTLPVSGFPVLGNWNLVHSREKHLSPSSAALRNFVHAEGAAKVEQATGISRTASLRGRL